MRPCSFSILLAAALLFLGVPTHARPAARPDSASRSNLLDINTATAAQLDALPGMGPAYARRVIEGRPYTAKNQLATRGVLPQSEYTRIAPYIVAKRHAH